VKYENTIKVQTQLIKDPIVIAFAGTLIVLALLLFGDVVTLSPELVTYLEKAFQLILSCAIGSMIGLEREYKQRPAGLRTYALVCLGSTLIMVVSFDIFERYHELANFDPTRLGAQVVSGIGFLGAGTIIHNKTSVKGLTSAAGLWVVASIGLAIGSKMYIEAIGYFLVVFFILHHFNAMERRQQLKYKLMLIEIITKDMAGILGDVGNVLGEHKLKVISMDVEREDEEPSEETSTNDEQDIKILISARVPYGCDTKTLKTSIQAIYGVGYVSSKKQSNGR